MTIVQGSRYNQGTVTRLQDSNGVYQLAVLRTTPENQVSNNLYVWQTGDRPDTVAAKVLGDPTAWWQIFDINPELINPLNVPPGTYIRIPVGSSSGLSSVLS